MNVALLADNLAFGGINRYCLDLYEGLKAHSDINVFLLALEDRNSQWLLQEAEALGVRIDLLPMSGVFDIRVIKHLFRFLVEREVDILHSQCYRGNIISRLTVRLGRVPTQLVCTVHGIYQKSSAPLRTKIFYTFDYLTLSASDHVVPVSFATGQQVSAYLNGKPVTVVHNGTRLPNLPSTSTKVSNRHLLNIPGETKVVSFVGRLSPQKGVIALIDVARKVLDCTNDVVFLVVGDGELRCKVECLAREYEGRVLLVGAQRDVSIYYHVSDVLLVPSPMEGLPMVILESFAHGVPVVASKVGGIPEVVVDGYNGLLCNPENAEEMHRCILRVLSDKALQQELGLHARATIESGFCLSQMAEQTYRVYLSTPKKWARSKPKF